MIAPSLLTSDETIDYFSLKKKFEYFIVHANIHLILFCYPKNLLRGSRMHKCNVDSSPKNLNFESIDNQQH